MKKVFTYFALLAFLFLGFVLGTSNILNDDPRGSKKINLSDKELKQKQLEHSKRVVHGQTDIVNPITTSATILYEDSMDGANDTTSLKNRGYNIYRRGGPPGVSPIWFQGNPEVFSAYNGPDNGYVASNYTATTGANPIDNWLIIPAVNTLAGDRLSFFSRSIFQNKFPDSIKVMYSATGASTPEDPSWVELDYFLVNEAGIWESRDFAAPTSGPNARFAIRYFVLDGGFGTNSNYIGIDMITVYRPDAVDVGTVSINEPGRTLIVPSPPFAPRATFKNFGFITQFNIPVTYEITGPVNYTSTKIISTLTPSATQQVIFDPFTPTIIGTYNITVYTSLFGDQDNRNDTMRSTFTILNANYGTSGTYSFANSILGTGAPSQPQYCWKDTSGSRSLIVNNAGTAPVNGTLDDGFFAVGLPTGKKIRFMGVDYDSVYIGTNGIVAFQRFIPGGGNWSPPPNGIPGGTVRPAFYPLWTDLDFSDTSVSNNRLSYKINNGFQLIITYDRAPLFAADATEYLSMQIVIDVVEDLYPVNSRILVQYSPSGTGSGVLNAYNNNTFQTHLVGLQDETGTNALMYRFQNTSDVIAPGPIFGASPIAVQFGPDATRLNNSCGTGTILLTALFEGCYQNNNNFTDTITVSLRNVSGDFETVDAARGTLNTAGTGFFFFTKIADATNYYVVVDYKNAIETWSATGLSLSGGFLAYDFTTGLDKAFGNNMKIVNTKATIYVGDVTGDEFVDASDISAIENDALTGVPGSVSGLPTDLTCDDFVDASDISIVENNTGIGVIRP